jgi:hypothetical protein
MNPQIEDAIQDFEVIATYVPQDLSKLEDSRGVVKNKDLVGIQLKYEIELRYKGRHVLTTPYSMGIGHVPGMSKLLASPVTMDGWNLAKDCFSKGTSVAQLAQGATQVKPKKEDVIHCLIMDTDVLDHSGFEDWADNYGYDTDSRKAETIYQICLELALKLRNAIGQDKLDQLRNAFQDY